MDVWMACVYWCGDLMVYRCCALACCGRYQGIDSSDEFITDLKVDGKSTPVAVLIDRSWKWPKSGVIQFFFTYFSEREPMPEGNYQALLQEVGSFSCIVSLQSVDPPP